MESEKIDSCPCGKQGDTEVLSEGARNKHGMVVACSTCALAYRCTIRISSLGEGCPEWQPLPASLEAVKREL
jgi:hypothetical protein